MQQFLEASKNEHHIDFMSQYCKLLLMSKDMMLLSMLNPELPTCSSLKDRTLKYGIFSPLEFKCSLAMVFNSETEAV